MVQPCNPKEVQRTLHYRVATYRERNFETGRSAKELLTKPALRAFCDSFLVRSSNTIPDILVITLD